MKKVIFSLLLTIVTMGAFAQVPYWGATVGEVKFMATPL